jgi:hypothetical protein
MRRSWAAIAAMWVLAATTAPRAPAVDFAFEFSDEEPGEGFLDPVLGQQRRDALAFAAGIWGRLIRPSFPSEMFTGEVIVVRARF